MQTKMILLPVYIGLTILTLLPHAFAGSLNAGAYTDLFTQEDKLKFKDDPVYTQLRTPVQIPKQYGKLITITPSKSDAVLWFESDDGKIRNVIVPATQMLLIQRDGTLLTP